jgi:hypothetical protein
LLRTQHLIQSIPRFPANPNRVALRAECYPHPEYRVQGASFMHACSGGWRDMRMRTRDGRVIETS